ncbi:hypothetical protein LOTGIDRAFT_159083 [Lottia gigantea]|uniref:Ionotropic glutamate receptor C-terminal domain-containing protein n=1 Tax=Lottia gigantea TaxID=225164 RepID=V4AMA9_LOTGI|nr:hypothetical protein LOTGIDRAFT_159083 [Lottia gigantea]ESO98287.1 hypothetical protein LOTGIDRAFT_159083 [Lottia gigantea]
MEIDVELLHAAVDNFFHRVNSRCLVFSPFVVVSVKMFAVLVLVTFGLEFTMTIQNDTSFNAVTVDLVKEIVMKSDENDVLIFMYDSEANNESRIWLDIDFHKYFLLAVDTMSEGEAINCLRSIAIQNSGKYMQFVVLTSDELIINILQLINRIDENSNKTINIRHWSKWIIFEREIDIGLLMATVQVFDNLFVIHTDTQKSCRGAATLLISKAGPKFCYVNISSGYDPGLAFPNMWPSFIDEKHENGSVKLVGYLVDLMDIISSTLNFTYSFYDDIESDWAGIINGTKTGLFYKIQSGDHDILCAPSSVTQDRLQILDYVLPMHFTDTVMPTYRLKPAESLKMIYTKPFQLQVWLIVFATFSGFCIIFWLQEKYHPYYQSGYSMQLKNLVFDVLRILLNQGGALEVGSLSGRISLSFFWIFCVIIAAVYKGNLVAFFTDKRTSEYFKDLNDVYNSDYKIGLVTPAAYTISLKKSKDPFLQKFSAKLERYGKEDPDSKSSNNSIHLARVLAGDYVYISDYASVSYIYVNNCDIVLMEDVYYQQYGLAVAKGSPLIYDLERVMRSLTTGGILDVSTKKWWPQRRKGFCDTPMTAKEIEMHDVTVLLIFISSCLALCSFVLLLEILHKRVKIRV